MYKFTFSAFSDEISGDLDIQTRVLNKHSIRYMDIRGVDGRNISEYTPAEARAIKSRLDKAGISVACIGSPLGKIMINDDFTAHLELASRVFETAGELGARYVRIFSFYIPKGDEPEVWRDEVVARLREMTRLAEKNGLVLLHENEKDIYGDTPERCLDILREVDSDAFRAVFDPANFVQCGVQAFPQAYELVKDYVSYIHIKDAVAADDTNVPAGLGDGHIPELIGQLKKIGYQGFLTLEPHLTAFEGLAGLELNLNKKFEALSGADGEEKFAVAAEALKAVLAGCGAHAD